MARAQTHIGSSKQVAAIPFVGLNIANASGTLTTTFLGTINANMNEYVAPYAGSVIGVSGRLNAALTTGTLQMFATVNGSASSLFSNGPIHVTAQGNSQTIEAERSGYTFAAGDRLGMGYYASDTINPTTNDGSFLLIVLFEGINY